MGIAHKHAQDVEALETQLGKLRRINHVLMERVERATDLQGNAFSLFETAITLESKVQDRTRDLEAALDQLAATNAALAAAKEAADDAQRRLRDAIGSINEGFALFDADHRLVLCNQTYLGFWSSIADRIVPGMTFTEIAEMMGRDGVARGALTAPDRWVSERLAQFQVLGGSHVQPLPDGRWIQINELRTSEGGIVGVYTDITDVKVEDARRRARELAEKGAILQATLDTIPQGVCVYDSERRLVAWNAALLAVMNLPAHGIPSINTHAGLVEVCQRLNGTMDPHEPLAWLPDGSPEIIARRHHANGKVVEVHRARMPDGGMVMSFGDITARLRAAQELHQANEMLERRVEERTADIAAVNIQLQQEIAERLAVEDALREAKTLAEQANQSKTRFLAAASHDLLQPLNATRLFVSALAEQTLPVGPRKLIEQTESALDSVEDLLEAILEISKLDAGAITPSPADFPLGELLRSMKAEFEPLARDRGLDFSVDESEAWVHSDPRLLRRIVQNFIGNALRYTEQGSVRVTCATRDGNVTITVTDTGPGIDPAHHAEIFQEFRRLRNESVSRGMGLGLAIVDRAARMLGHSIDLVSAPDEGSAFSVRVPIGQPSMVGRPMALRTSTSHLHGRCFVVIDNEESILAGMAAVLDGWNCRVIAARSIADALKIITPETVIDAVIADYHLDNGETGDDAIELVRRHYGRPLPAVIVTADRTRELRDRIVGAGYHWLNKPLKLAQLRALLSRIVS